MAATSPSRASGGAGSGPVLYRSAAFQHPPISEIKDLEKEVQATVFWSDGDVETLSLHEWKAARARDSPRPGEKNYRVYDGLDDWLIDQLNEHFDNDRLGKLVEGSLKDGTWKEKVKAALDSSIVGEDHLKMILLYSGLSSCLSERLHVFINGDSQKGKTYIEGKVGELFPPDRVITVQTMSAKAGYYRAGEEGADYYANKILALDEFAHLSDDTRATVQALMSLGDRPLVNDTVSDHKKAVRQVIEGRPVVWANSAELFDDALAQLKNRFFTASIDESEELDRRVNERQREIAKYGRPAKDMETLALARSIVAQLMTGSGHQVLLPLIDAVQQRDMSNRGEFERFRVLVSAITFANRHRRPSFEEEGTEYVLASLSDLKEAMELWGRFDRSQSTGLPPRHQKVLEVMGESPMSLVEITAAYNVSLKKGRSTKTVLNYLNELTERDLVTVVYVPGKEDGERPIKKFALVNSPVLPISQFFPNQIGRGKNQLREMLANELKRLNSVFPNFPTKWENLIDSVLDTPEPSYTPPERSGPSPVSEEEMHALIAELRDPKLHHDRTSLKDSFPTVDVDRLIFEGHITEGPNGLLYWHGR